MTAFSNSPIFAKYMDLVLRYAAVFPVYPYFIALKRLMLGLRVYLYFIYQELGG